MEGTFSTISSGRFIRNLKFPETNASDHLLFSNMNIFLLIKWPICLLPGVHSQPCLNHPLYKKSSFFFFFFLGEYGRGGDRMDFDPIFS